MLKPNSLVLCAGCNLPIFDRYLLHVLDKAWHSTCVRCSECKILLVDKCFTRANRLFCNDDFFRRFGTKCAGCNQVIAFKDLIRKARDKIFHIDCFCCSSCQKRLDTGEELYIINGCEFLCKEDYYSTSQRNPNLKRIIDEAVAEVEQKSGGCLRFKKVDTKPDGPHLFFKDEPRYERTSTCATSPVGKRFHGNEISVSPSCQDQN